MYYKVIFFPKNIKSKSKSITKWFEIKIKDHYFQVILTQNHKITSDLKSRFQIKWFQIIPNTAFVAAMTFVFFVLISSWKSLETLSTLSETYMYKQCSSRNRCRIGYNVTFVTPAVVVG